MNDNDANSIGRVGPESLGRVIDRHGAALELFAAGWCDCPEDALQEVLIELAARETAPEPLLPWLYRAIRYRALNARRAAQRRRRHENEAAQARPSVLTGPPGKLLDAATATEALATLSDELREVVVAYLWGGLTFRDIGQVTDTSESTAHRRYRDALVKIRQVISNEHALRSSCKNEN